MRVGRFLLIGLLFGLLLVGVMLGTLPSPTDHGAGSVFSTDEDGRRAAYLLLAALDFEAGAWTSSPGNLGGEQLLFLPAVPETPPGYGADPARPAPGEGRGSRRLRDPLHYLRFVEQGGTLVAELDEELSTFLVETLGRAELSGVSVWESEPEEDAAAEPRERELRLASGEAVTLAEDPPAWLELPSAGSSLEVLAEDAAGRVHAAWSRAGRGRVVLLASDSFLDNEHLGGAQNALYLVRLVEALAPRGRVLFDEYVLGGWDADSPLELAFSRPNFPFSAHLAALAGLALWSFAWVRDFPRDPEPLRRLSVLARAQALAGLLAGAGRWSLLAELLRLGVVRRLAGRRVTALAQPAAPPERGEPIRHDAERSTRRAEQRLLRDPERLAELLAPRLAPLEPETRRRSLAAFAAQRVESEQELEVVAARLAELERALAERTRGEAGAHARTR